MRNIIIILAGKANVFLSLSDIFISKPIENLKAKIYDGKATRADITRVTRRLGDEIAAVYGFDIPRQKKNIERAR